MLMLCWGLRVEAYRWGKTNAPEALDESAEPIDEAAKLLDEAAELLMRQQSS